MPVSRAALVPSVPPRSLGSVPPELGRAIAITGSVSRGYADRFSDIEMRFLVDEAVSLSDCMAWLTSIGGIVEPEDEASWEGGCQTKSWHDGIFIEALWQPWDALTAHLERVLRAETTDHWAITGVWHVADALVLREDVRFAQVQARLAEYPAALGERLIGVAVAPWCDPHWWPVSLANIWPLAERGARLALAAKLIAQVERGLRILFAVNGLWEPDYKWLAGESRRLSHAPTRLVERVNAVFTHPDARASVIECLTLLHDILCLAPDTPDVARASEQMRAVMDFDHLPAPRGL